MAGKEVEHGNKRLHESRKMNLKGCLKKEKIFFLYSGNMFYVPNHFSLVLFPACGLLLRLDMSLLRYE
jgi:hypothetical protein